MADAQYHKAQREQDARKLATWGRRCGENMPIVLISSNSCWRIKMALYIVEVDGGYLSDTIYLQDRLGWRWVRLAFKWGLDLIEIVTGGSDDHSR